MNLYNCDSLQFIKAGISELLKNRNAYDGKWVETTGTIIFAFEIFALIPDSLNKDIMAERQSIWLKYLPYNGVKIEDLSTKKFKIRGLIRFGQMGHGGVYPATFENICLLEELD